MSTPSAFVPRPRRQGVVSQEVDGETLLYVEATHQALCLNSPAARIWALCDGERTVEGIAALARTEPALVALALGELGNGGLLENAEELPSRVNLGRRRLLVGLAAIPAILIVTAPRAAAAASCQPPGPCNVAGGPCCTNGSACPPIGQICP